MRRWWRRHRPLGSNLPESRKAYVIGVFSIISVIVHIICLHLSVTTSGNTDRWVGGVGVLFILAGFGAIFVGIREFRDVNLSLRSRLIALIAPLVAEAVWLYLYILGITVNG